MSTRNDYWAYLQPQSGDIQHHGVKGMKWGVRKDRYESYRTRKLRRKIEVRDEDLRTGNLSSRSKKRISKQRNKLYSKYNTQKNRDLARKASANRNPSQLRNIGMFIVKDFGILAGTTAAASITIAALGKPQYSGSVMKGASYAASLLGAQNLYSTIENARAIEGVQNDGTYDLTRR